MADENTNSSSGDFGKMPSFDFTKLMKDFKLPGVDLAAIMDRERKNIEALIRGQSCRVRRLAGAGSPTGRDPGGIDQAGRRNRARRGCGHQAHGHGGSRFRDDTCEYARIDRDGGQIPNRSVRYHSQTRRRKSCGTRCHRKLTIGMRVHPRTWIAIASASSANLCVSRTNNSRRRVGPNTRFRRSDRSMVWAGLSRAESKRSS